MNSGKALGKEMELRSELGMKKLSDVRHASEMQMTPRLTDL
jgi:hypothetical protein